MQIRWSQMHELRSQVQQATERRLQALNQTRSDLIDIRIASHREGNHRHGGRGVHISALLRGRRVAARSEREEIEFALADALEAFEREVLDLRQRRREWRGAARPVAPPVRGVIERIYHDEGYGFVLTDDGTRVYFHRTGIRRDLDFASLAAGQRVGFDLEPSESGPQASALILLPPGMPAA